MTILEILKSELKEVQTALAQLRSGMSMNPRPDDGPAYKAMATHEMMILNRLSLEDEA